MTNKLCLMPFTSLMINPSGMYRVCPSMKGDLGLVDELINFNDVWNGEKLIDIRQNFLKNQWPKQCLTCEDSENINTLSRRQRYNSKRRYSYGESVCDAVVKSGGSLFDLDISFSNQCNLNCTMCSSEYSSQWIKWDRKAIQAGHESRNRYSEHLKTRTIPVNIIDQILANHLPNLRSIMIKGGEPLIDKNCFYFLEKIAQSKNTHPNLNIYIQTNATVVPKQLEQLAEKLALEIGISIDGTNECYEWIRGFAFEQLQKNIKKLAQLPNLKRLSFTYTSSAFNVCNLPNFIEFALKMQTKYPQLQYCNMFGTVRQSYGNLSALPLEVRQKIAKQVKDQVEEHKDFFQNGENLIKLLLLPQSDKDVQMRVKKWINFCNQMRMQDFSTFNSALTDWLANTTLTKGSMVSTSANAAPSL